MLVKRKTIFVPVPFPNDIRRDDIIVGFEKGYLVVKHKVSRICKVCGRKAKNEKELIHFEKDRNSRFGRKNLCNKCKAEEISMKRRAKKIGVLLEAKEREESSLSPPQPIVPRSPTTYKDWIDFFSYAREMS